MDPSHFLFFPVPAWGHIRPLCILATRLIHEQENTVVTFIVAPHLLDKTKAEAARQFPDQSSNDRQRLRILPPSLSISNENGVDPVDAMNDSGNAYHATYHILHHAQPITCSVTGTTYDAVPAPCAVMLDYFGLPQLASIKAVSGHSVPIIACVAAPASAITRMCGPESVGGVGDVGAKIDAEVARTGLSVDEVTKKLWLDGSTAGRLVQIAGLPPMYDHEFFPQRAPLDAPIDVITKARSSFVECDGIVVTTTYAFETVALESMKQGFQEMQKEVHVLGPLLPLGYGTETQNTAEEVSDEMQTFLGEMLAQHGERSVFFVSFGTLFWPAVPGYLDELIEVLLEKKVPFILACSSAGGKLSEEQMEKMKSSGLGMVAAWCPQQFILNHRATGWFVTHGGFNSVIESLASGIPLICWPFVGDQPYSAVHVSETLKAAFELFQVRVGEGLKPIYRKGLTPAGTREAVGVEIRETIDLCRGEKGRELRCNAEKLKVEIAKAWEEDGSARQEIRKFLRTYT